MTKFTKIIAPALIAAIGLGGMTTAASAQPFSEQRYSHQGPRDQADRQFDRHDTVRADIDQLRAKIDRAQDRHAISKREARGLRREATEIQATYARYARGGLSVKETRLLQNRIDRVEMALRAERRDHDGRRG